MKNVIVGQAASTAPTLHLATFRRNILAVVVGNPLFTDAEQLRTNHHTHECTCPYRLVRWLKNVRRVAAEREYAQGIASLAEGIAQFEAKLAGATAPAYATPAQCDEVFALTQHPALLACEKAQALTALFTLTQVGAVRLIGKLWSKVLHRTGQGVSNDGSTSYPA
ncbi:MAG: hypothetical protein ACRYFX_12900 [Janthinobacterium lividum]